MELDDCLFPLLMTPKQVSQLLGVHTSTLRRWCREGLLPFVKITSRTIRFPRGGVMTLARALGTPLPSPSEP